MLFPALPLMLVALAALVWLGRRRPGADRAAAVAAQHLRLFRGASLSRSAVEAARESLQLHLERGDTAAVEAAMRPGLEYAVQARALAEIGSDDAARVLERQLARKLTRDGVERAWYRIDALRGLRDLQNPDSLPVILEAADDAVRQPLGQLFALEVVSFPAFASYLEAPASPLGRPALRVLGVALRGLRRGTAPAALVASNRLGEAVSRLVRHCPDAADPLVAQVFLEVLRTRRRSGLTPASVPGDPHGKHAVRRQAACILAAEPVVREYLHGIGDDLVRLLPFSEGPVQESTLQTLAELHWEAGHQLLPWVLGRVVPYRSALPCLRWSPDPEVGAFLRARAEALGQLSRRRLPLRVSKTTLDADEDLRQTLLALRGHPSAESERLLCRFATSRSPAIRAAAMSGLGWWEPVFRAEVIGCLRHHRDDGRFEDVRWSALAALGRLGERTALNEIRARLSEGNPVHVCKIVDRLAGEGITLLWPDLDRLTEAEDAGTAAVAWDALERMREDLFGPLG